MLIVKGSGSWASALTSVSTATDGGFTDWRIPDKSELSEFVNVNTGLNYAPFSISSGNQQWTSNTSTANTVRANTFESNNRGRMLDQTKTSSFELIYIRNW